MSPVGISLMMLLALAGFALLAWRKLQIVVSLQAEPRWDDPWQRARTVLVNGFLQRRMVQREWRSGVMHTVIFVGFMALLLRKLQLIAIGYDERFVLPDWVAGPFATFKDVVEIAVTLAVLYGLWRRLVLRPARLERNPEGLMVLGLILVIMLPTWPSTAFALRSSAPACRVWRTNAPLPLLAARWHRPRKGCRPPPRGGATRSSIGCRWWWCSAFSSGCRWVSISTSPRPCRRCISAAAGLRTACRLWTSTG